MDIAPFPKPRGRPPLCGNDTGEWDEKAGVWRGRYKAQEITGRNKAEIKEAMKKVDMDTCVKSVYLGDIRPLRNKQEQIPSTEMSKMIRHAFSLMDEETYQRHDLRHYFEVDLRGGGYMPKMVDGRIMMQIDHIFPKSWGGVDHPRNYAAMHAKINASFGDTEIPAKIMYIAGDKRRARALTRAVKHFNKACVDALKGKGSLEQFFENAQ